MSDEIRAVLDGVRVLYVEDHDDTRALMTLLLGGAGATVLAVASADEALAALEREPPDVLVSDTRMLGRNGWELVEQVRTWSRARGGQIPAIAVTGAASDEDRAHSLRSGFDAHLSKPIDMRELVRTIATLVGRGGMSHGASS
jgi:CheY-like chemotaxis protein